MRPSFERVVFQPDVYQGLQKGINKIVKSIRPTLGPFPRLVAISQVLPGKTPELLDNGGVIARRIQALPNRDEDMGAMLARHLLWRIHQEVGDGTATTAVLFQAVFNEGVKYVVSGGNATRLQHFLGEGLSLILEQLSEMTVHLEGKEKLSRVAESICYDVPLANMLGEIFDIIGEYGQLEIRSGRSRELEREYVEGMYWRSGFFSREMISDIPRLSTEQYNGAILISDLSIENQQELLPVLDCVRRSGITRLLIVADKLSPGVIALILSASRDKEKFNVIAAKTPGASSTEKAEAIQDLALLTGGKPYIQAAGENLNNFKLEHLGRARRAWVNLDYLGIAGGNGDPRMIRKHIQNLRQAYAHSNDTDRRKALQERIGKLIGGAVILWVGATTSLEVETRKAVATRTAQAMRTVIREGVIPGGGVALRACQPVLREKIAQSSNSDQRAAYRILNRAVEIPMRTILANAGYEPSTILAQLNWVGSGSGFDVRTGKITEMPQVGIWDSAAVLKAAVRGAITSAALALSTDVMIHKKKPEVAMQT